MNIGLILVICIFSYSIFWMIKVEILMYRMWKDEKRQEAAIAEFQHQQMVNRKYIRKVLREHT